MTKLLPDLRGWSPADRLFAVAIAVQGFHFVEHVAQVIQKFGLGQAEAHGLLGRLDFEWVHFGYNTALLLALAAAVALWRASPSRGAWDDLSLGIFGLGVAVQTYHWIEHVVRLNQFLGDLEPVGILGTTFNIILLHFSINLIVYALMLAAFVGRTSLIGRRPMFITT